MKDRRSCREDVVDRDESFHEVVDKIDVDDQVFVLMLSIKFVDDLVFLSMLMKVC